VSGVTGMQFKGELFIKKNIVSLYAQNCKPRKQVI